MSSLTVAFYFNAALALLAAAASALRGKKYVYGLEGEMEIVSVPVPASRTGSLGAVPNDPSPSTMIRIAGNRSTALSDGNKSANSRPDSTEASAATRNPEEG
jgi:hypothetical protein